LAAGDTPGQEGTSTAGAALGRGSAARMSSPERRRRMKRILRSCALAGAVGGLLLAGVAGAADEHAGHGHHGHGAVAPMDAEGRRLESYDQRHDMTPEARAG